MCVIIKKYIAAFFLDRCIRKHGKESKMKHPLSRLIALSLAALMLLSAFASCDTDPGKTDDTTQSPSSDPPISDPVDDEVTKDNQIAPLDYDTAQLASFDYAPGVYYDAIALSITPNTAGNTVRYTTDCSEPTADSPIFEEALPLSYTAEAAEAGCRVVNLRARCFDAEGNPIGRVVSATYIFPESEDRFTTRVISLVTEQKNLYGDTGILTNYSWKGKMSERPVNFQLYSADGELLIVQDMGIRIYGTGSRGNAQKNFRLFARKEYSPYSGHVNYPIWNDLYSEYTGARIEEFDKILVRGGASNFHNSMITNLVGHEMMEDSAVPAGDFEPAALYMNGEYYGMMMMIEDYDTYSYESHYGANEDQVTTINFGVHADGLTWELDDGTAEEYAEWKAVDWYLYTTDFSNEDEYQRVCQIMDIQNMIEYITFQCYVNNWDWPRNNQRIWRYSAAKGESMTGATGVGGYDPTAPIGQDGRWRYVIKDIDVSMGMNVNPDLNYYARLDVGFFDVMRKDRHGENHMYDIFKNLMRNPDFCRRFYLYVCEFMNTRGSVEEYLEVINTLSLQVAEEMKYHVAEYGDDLTEWDRHLECMREFAQLRPAIVLQNMHDYNDQYSHGYRLNTVKLTIKGQGTVLYNGAALSENRTIYSIENIAIPISFEPAPGYKFQKIVIEGGENIGGKLTLTESECSIMVQFVKDSSYTAPTAPVWPVINEVGFTSAHRANGCDWVELYNPSQAEIDLSGYVLQAGTESFTLPAIKLVPDAFTIIFFGADKGANYAPFGLSGSDTVVLLSKDNEKLDEVTLLVAGENGLVGRYPDGGDWVELSAWDITPGKANIYGKGERHNFDEACQNTVMFNGYLLPTAIFSRNSDGQLTFTRSALKGFESKIPTDIYNGIEALLQNKKDTDTIIVEDLLRDLKENYPQIKIYTVDSLGSYIIRFA